MRKKTLLRELDRVEAETEGQPLLRLSKIALARDLLVKQKYLGVDAKKYAKQVIEEYSR